MPGRPIIGLLPRIRSAVSRIGRPQDLRRVGHHLAGAEHGRYAGVHARFSSVARWKVTVTGSNGATVRSSTGAGSEAKVRWNGRTAGGASPRPVTSRVFVDRTPAPAGGSTGGFSAGAWRVSNVNAEQLSTSAGAFASYRWGRSGDIPVVGAGTATAPRASACSATPTAACSTCSSAATGTGSWSATGTATAPGPRASCAAAPAGT